jgi:uncharacterized protein (TIGR02246 family)
MTMSRDIDDVREILARYVRATDSRDGAAMARLFVPDGKVQIFYGRGEKAELLGELVGRDAIAHAVGALMEPHPDGGWSHHATQDPIVTVDGDRATLDAQYVVFSVRAKARPREGWPREARGAQGTITPIESGYYRSTLTRTDGRWLIVNQRIDGDLPMAFPAEGT